MINPRLRSRGLLKSIRNYEIDVSALLWTGNVHTRCEALGFPNFLDPLPMDLSFLSGLLFPMESLRRMTCWRG
jgi:hypothetical protein